MKQVKLIIITTAIIIIWVVNVSQQQANARNDNETAANEQNPDKEFDVPQLPIGQIVPFETNTTSFSIS
jgi:uncharacterized alpha/beta hydrolase family protein